MAEEYGGIAMVMQAAARAQVVDWDEYGQGYAPGPNGFPSRLVVCVCGRAFPLDIRHLCPYDDPGPDPFEPKPQEVARVASLSRNETSPRSWTLRRDHPMTTEILGPQLELGESVRVAPVGAAAGVSPRQSRRASKSALDSMALATAAKEQHERERAASRAGLPWEEMSPDYRERRMMRIAESVSAYVAALNSQEDDRGE